MPESRRGTAETPARDRWRSRCFFCVLWLLAWTAAAAVASGAAPPRAAGVARRVLIVSSYGTDFPLFSQIGAALRSDLTASWRQNLDFYEVTLDHTLGDDGERMAPFIEYLSALLETHPFDLVVTLGGPAARFARDHLEELFRGVPILYAAHDDRLVDPSTLGANVAQVPVDVAPIVVVETLLEVLPDTENVAVVIGNSPIERFWRATLARELEPFEKRVRLLWSDGMSLTEISAWTGSLPPRSAVFFVLFLSDRSSERHSQSRALAAIRLAANAPVFGLFDTQLGQGVVGGRMLGVAETAERVTEAASRLLRGEAPASVRYPPVRATRLRFDGRELERWGIPARRLPPGSVIGYTVPSPWTTYRWQILGGVAIFGLQSALIGSLLLHRRHRRTAETEVRQLHARLLATYEQERRRLARELHDDVTQRLARLAIDGARVEQTGWTPEGVATLREMRHELVRLGHDVHTLSRRLHPSILEDLGLVEALRSEAERVARATGMTLDLRLEAAPAVLPSEVGLCLFRAAQEALRNVEHHSRATRVEVALEPRAGGLELSVRDDGIGFDRGEIKVTQGLGQHSMRERLNLVGGRLAVESAVGRGTTVRAWVPVEESPT